MTPPIPAASPASGSAASPASGPGASPASGPAPASAPSPADAGPADAGPAAAGPASVVIVGGGISGLAAAYALRNAGLTVTVLEGSPRLGGKLAVSEVGGIPVDAGAESLLARRPEGTGLIAALGLDGERRDPGTTSAGIWTRGRLRPLPRRQFMGVPADPGELAAAGLLSEHGLARARRDADLPPAVTSGDASVAERVSARMGQEVVDRLVEPLLGGVYAGRTEDLSFEATLGPLAAAAARFPTLGEAVSSLLPHAPPAPPAPPVPPQSAPPPQPGDMPTPAMSGSPTPAAPPVFTTLAGGLGTLPAVLAAASGAVIRTKATVRELTRANDGRWRLTIGPASAPERLEADAVILALPARPASRLLAGPAPAAAAALAEISYASMAIITLAYPQDAFPAAPSGSGFLVPAVDGHAVKAVTFSTVKWPHLRAPGSLHIVRCSVGRLGDEAVLQRDDADLASLAAADLAVATGVRGRPADTRVTRWGGGLPQYSVGHLGRVTRIRAGVAEHPGLAVCGAAYDGVGIPACVASAQTAADRVIAHLSSRQKLRSS